MAKELFKKVREKTNTQPKNTLFFGNSMASRMKSEGTKWVPVALFFWVRAISASISLIFSMIPIFIFRCNHQKGNQLSQCRRIKQEREKQGTILTDRKTQSHDVVENPEREREKRVGLRRED